MLKIHRDYTNGMCNYSTALSGVFSYKSNRFK